MNTTIYYKARLLVFTILIVFMLAPLGWAVTYYVDTTNGRDTNTGLSEATAWKTIAKVNALRSNPGDQILFKRGEIWREQINLSSSGASGNPITISAFGVGPDPIISGADLVNGPAWTTIAPSVWGTTVAVQPKVAFFNGQRGTRVGSLSALASQYDWFWSNNTLYIYSSTNPSVGYTAPGVEVASRPACVFVTGSFVTIQGLHVSKSNTFAGIFVWTNTGATEGITIEACRSSDNYQTGIRVANAHALLKTTDVSVTSNIVYNNGASGIDIGTGVNNARVERNTVYNNTWSADFIHQAGIHFWGNQIDGDNLTVKFNESYGNAGTGNWGRGNGLHLDEVGSNVMVAYNRFHDNQDVGILVENSKDVRIHYNLVYRNGEDGILLFRSCSGTKVYNNVAHGNKHGISIRGNNTSNEMFYNVIKNNIAVGNRNRQLVAIYGGENDGAMGSGNIYEYNCFGLQGTSFIEWGAGATKSAYAAWESAYGKSTHSINSDPRLIDPSGGNFKIDSKSPCIDTGTNVGLSTDYNGTAVPLMNGVDIGAFEYKTSNAPKNLRILY